MYYLNLSSAVDSSDGLLILQTVWTSQKAAHTASEGYTVFTPTRNQTRTPKYMILQREAHQFSECHSQNLVQILIVRNSAAPNLLWCLINALHC